MCCMTYLYVLILFVAVHTPDFRDNKKYKHVTVNSTNLPNELK